MAAEQNNHTGQTLCCTPPPTQRAELAPQKAPVTDRSFFVPEDTIDPNLRAPMDEQTGMPLPIAPRSDLTSRNPEDINEHHGWFPRLHPALRTRGGRALRASRLQRVEKSQHNHGDKTALHALVRFGPELPTVEAEQFGLCALALALYLPDKVVDTSGGEIEVRSMKDWEHNRLSELGILSPPRPKQVKSYRDKWLPGMSLVDAKQHLLLQRQKQADFGYRNMHYGFDPLREFVRSYVFEQDLSDVKPSLRRKFIYQGDIEAGLTLLGVASVTASRTALIRGQPLDAVYGDLYRREQLHPLCIQAWPK